MTESTTPAATDPEAPRLLRPLDGELLVGNLGFAWSPVSPLPEGGRYELQLWPLSEAPRGIVQTAEAAWDGPLVLEPGIYNWRVRVLDAGGQPLAESEPFTFTWRP
ncbi:MAG: hypothetical protein M5U01_27255 [Ardenticatenaceae bacterium]|nr:hypothetical protein [Ardenticatenaceae bacterium]HBY98702.1 hypothetical protein [Chloroflexota bacterium]